MCKPRPPVLWLARACCQEERDEERDEGREQEKEQEKELQKERGSRVASRRHLTLPCLALQHLSVKATLSKPLPR